MKNPLRPRHVALLISIAGGCGLGYLVYPRLREGSRRSHCQTNLKRIGLALKQYERDYDGTFVRTANWKAALSAYSSARGSSEQATRQLFTCSDASGYAFNSHLGGRLSVQVRDGAILAAFYDPRNGIHSDRGENWNPNGVHGGGHNVGFVDGHVQWLKQQPAFWAADLAIAPHVFRSRFEAEGRLRDAQQRRYLQHLKRENELRRRKSQSANRKR